MKVGCKRQGLGGRQDGGAENFLFLKSVNVCHNVTAIRFIRECTATGRPCGDEESVRRMELENNRDFTRKKPAQKPKAKDGEPPMLWSDDRIVR